MAISTYSDLVAGVQTYMVYDDISGAVDALLSLAESTLNREIRIRGMQSSQVVASQTDQVMTLPTDFAEAIVLYEGGSEGGVLEYLPPKMFFSSRDSRTGSGQPAFYTVTDDGIVLAPAPDSARAYTLDYYAKVPGLSATQTTNAILTEAPDVYVWAVLYQAAILAGDEALEAKYERNYEKVKMALLAADKRARTRPGARMRSRVTRDGAYKIA